MDDANLTMEAYIKLEAEKALRRGQMFNWETATYRKFMYHENIGYFNYFETNFPAIVFDDALATDHKISFEPMVSPLDDNEIDFRISFDESDNEDYTFMYDKNSYSSKLIPVNNLKTDLENDSIRVNSRGQDLFTSYAWRKRETRMFGSYFVGCLAEHFRLVTEEGLRGLTMMVGELGTKPHRMARLEEEVHGLRESFGEQCAVLDEMSRDFSRYHTRDAPNEGQMGLAPQQPHILTTSPIFNLSSLDTPGFTFLWTCLNTAYPGFGIQRIDFLTLLNENDDFGRVFIF
ncbi:hypothetical protein Tco_0583546 [Tanacetum coccineum]